MTSIATEAFPTTVFVQNWTGYCQNSLDLAIRLGHGGFFRFTLNEHTRLKRAIEGAVVQAIVDGQYDDAEGKAAATRYQSLQENDPALKPLDDLYKKAAQKIQAQRFFDGFKRVLRMG